MKTAESTIASVRDYYSSVLETNADLKTTACCSSDAMPAYVRAIIADIDDEVVGQFYGCGSPIPVAVGGCRVVDLGCGTGRDAYILSKLVGDDGDVIGIDMTESQLDVARKHIDSQSRRFGYEQSNVDFRFGYIEDLKTAGLEDNSVDVVISNCVLNLSPDKNTVFSEIFRVLKPGGELFFSDVFADRRVPRSVALDPVLYGECLGGALYLEDFRRLLADLGCLDFRVTARSGVDIQDPELRDRIGPIEFESVTIRAFNLPDLVEDKCEDYGQVATYLGTIPESRHAFELDDHHVFEAGRPMLVCGNTASMLEATRYGKHFSVNGDRSQHFGLFDCGDPATGTTASAEVTANGGSCC